MSLKKKQNLVILLAYLGVYLCAELIANYLKLQNTLVFTVSMTWLLIGLLWWQRKNFSLLDKKQYLTMIFKSSAWAMVLLIIEITILLAVTISIKQHMTNQHTEMLVSLVRSQRWYIVYLMLGAPLLEELVFRKALFELIKGPNKVTQTFAVIVVSLFFALIHQDKAYIGYFLFGVFLQWEYIHYQDIRYSMITHAVLNSLTLGVLLLV